MASVIKFKEKIEDITKKQYTWTKDFYSLILFAILIGTLSGFLMVGFFYLLDLFRIGFLYLPFFIGPLIAGLLTSIAARYCRTKRVLGSGISEFMKEVREIKEAPEECDLKTVIWLKPFTTGWTFGSGMICGRFGPGLLIGGGLGFELSKLSKKFEKYGEISYYIGASACTAAVLKAPISGSLFCAELPFNNHIKYKSIIPSMIASSFSYFIFCIFFGFEPLITTALNLTNILLFNYGLIFPLLFFFGICIGIIVFLFNNIFLTVNKEIINSCEEKPGVWVLPFIGGIGYSIFLIIIFHIISPQQQNAIMGVSANYLNSIIENILNLDVIFFLSILFLVIIAIFISLGTQNSAGIIFPIILVGFILGGIFGLIFYPSEPLLFMLLGIPAFLGAATKNPIASVFLIIEITWVPILFIPAAITTAIAYIISGPSSLISGQFNATRI